MPIPSERATVDADSPWPGLAVFQEADQGFFRGRRREAEALYRRVRRERLTVLFAKSGLGKSSLLRAGLFPRVRAENVLPVYVRLDFSSQGGPGLAAQVMQAIAEAAGEAGVEAPELRPDDTLWQCFHRQNADFWSPRNRLLQPLLVFDQFEETFSLGHGDVARVAATGEFLAELGDLVEGSPPAALTTWLEEHPEAAEDYFFDRHPYKVVLALREDFLPELEGLRRRIPSVGRNRYRLGPMNGDAALEVILQVPDLIEPRIAEMVVRFVAASDADAPLGELKVEPALLSVVCRELNNRRLKRGEPRITADLLAGSQGYILSDFYEHSVADLPPEVRTFVEEELVTVSGYRDSVAVENALDLPGVTPEAIDRLVARRLVRVEARGGVQRLELTQDLITGVITASRDEARERRARRQLRRSRTTAAVFLVLALLAVGAAYWARMAQKDVDRQRANAARAQEQADAQRRVAEAMEREARAAVAAAERHEAITREALRESLRLRGLVTETARLAEEERLRREAEARLRSAGEKQALGPPAP